MSARADFLSPLIGSPWSWRSQNCWDFAAHVERELFGRVLPRVDVPSDLSKRWVLDAIEAHPEREMWREVEDGGHGIVTAPDGALVLMAHLRMPAHIGVWLRPEMRVIHCSEQHGVCFETVLALRQMGWRKITFYEPKGNDMAGDLTITGSMMATTSIVATAFVIGNQIKINLGNGSIERLAGFTTDDAAALSFWEAVERMNPRGKAS